MSESKDPLEEFKEIRKRRTRAALEAGSLNTKRFYALDGSVFEQGALDSKTKELMGLVASAVARCDECIDYHLDRCKQMGVSTQELVEALDIALMIGGSVVIPHHRRAVEIWLRMSASE